MPGGQGNNHFDFCGASRMLLYGGQYSSDNDHQQVVDGPGAIWIYQPSNVWQMDEVFLGSSMDRGRLGDVMLLPMSRSDHALVKIRNLNEADEIVIYGGVISDGKAALGE